MNQALTLCEDYKEAKGNSKHKNQSALHWQPLEAGSWKLNVNGAIFSNHHSAGEGFMLRDGFGQVIAVATHLEMYFTEPMEIELLTILRVYNFVFRWV